MYMKKSDVLFTTRVLDNPFNTNAPSFLSEVEYSFLLRESDERHMIRTLVPCELIIKYKYTVKINKTTSFSLTTRIEDAYSIERARDLWRMIQTEMVKYIEK